MNNTHIKPQVIRFATPRAEGRIEEYDLARAVAFMGMVFVNFWVLMDNAVACPGWLVFCLNLVQGRAAATFVVLAGVGLSLLSKDIYLHPDRTAIRQNRHKIWRRAALLFIIGLLNGLIWPADILHFYALYFAAGAILVTFSTQSLAALLLTPVLIYSLFMGACGFDAGYEWGPLMPAELLDPSRVARHFLFSGHYPFFPWFSFVILGAWLGRQDLSNVRIRKTLLMLATGAMVFSEGLSWFVFDIAPDHIFGRELEPVLMWLAIDPWEPMPLFMISAGGTSIIVIVVLVIGVQHCRKSRWLQPWIAMGQCTLTLYILHIVLGETGLKTLAYWHVSQSLFPLWGSLLFLLMSLFASFLWKKHFQKGPLEWVMHKLIHAGQPQRNNATGLRTACTTPSTHHQKTEPQVPFLPA